MTSATSEYAPCHCGERPGDAAPTTAGARLRSVPRPRSASGRDLRPERSSLRDKTADLARRRAQSAAAAEPATARQHSRGKLVAHERIALLLDDDSFLEIGSLRHHHATGFGLDRRHPANDGVVTGCGTIHGRQVFVYAHDFRVFGGSLGAAHAAKIAKLLDLAYAAGAPVIGLNDGTGARIQEGVAALAGYGEIFRRNVRASGVIPQISVMLGPCAGGASYSPALTDFVFMVRGTSHMFLTGPDVVQAVTGEVVSQEALGGADTHGSKSGVASFVYDDERSCLEEVRYLVSMLPSSAAETPPWFEPEDDPRRDCAALLDIVPGDPRQPYDIRQVMAEIVDDGDLMEVHRDWAANLVCVLARIDGHVVGLVGNQPQVSAGVLDIAASEKGARFVRTCDAFSIPLVSLVDVPGFLPGVDQEHRGVIRHGAKLLYAYCEATVPRVQLVLRKAYGGAYIVMDSASIGADLSFAWPTNEIAVMGAEAAVNVISRRELNESPDPESLRAELTEEYRSQLMHPFYAAERGYVDEVIDPRDTRRRLVHALSVLRGKNRPTATRKHGNPPL